MNAIKISFNRISSKANREGKAPVWCTISSKGQKRLKFSTGIYLFDIEWDKRKQKVKSKHERAIELNDQFNKLSKRIYSTCTDVTGNKDNVDLETVREKLSNKPEAKPTLIKLYEDYIAHLKSKKNVDDVDNTTKHLNSNKRKLIKYVEHKYKRSDILIENLNFEFIEDFETYLRSYYNNCANTIDRATSKLKTVIRYGIRTERIVRNPFFIHKGKKEPTNRQFLTMDELTRIEQLVLPENSSVLFVRDFFLFMTYTGLSYMDAIKFCEKDMFISNQGNNVIQKRRGKTNVMSTVVLMNKANALIKKYKNHPNSINRSAIFPYKPNQTINKKLKEVAVEAKIEKTLSCHIARHTFATLCLENGASIETVSKSLGHSSIKTTEIYAKVTLTKIEREYKLLGSFLS